MKLFSLVVELGMETRLKRNGLLSDTKLTKNIIQLIFIRYFTGDFAQVIQALPDICR